MYNTYVIMQAVLRIREMMKKTEIKYGMGLHFDNDSSYQRGSPLSTAGVEMTFLSPKGLSSSSSSSSLVTLDGCRTGAAGRGGFVGAALGVGSIESPDKSGAFPVAARSSWAFCVITVVKI